MRRVMSLLAVLASAWTPIALAREAPVIAEVCTSCHLAEHGSIRGTFDAIALRSGWIQVRMDDQVEVLRFDPRSLEVVEDGRPGTVASLERAHKPNEVRVSFVTRDGVKYATRITVMPPVRVPPELRIDTPALEQLVRAGPVRGRYTLVDARPASRFAEGFIPTATSLPFPELARHVGALPRDRRRLLVFYGTGPNCSMSVQAARRARSLGYTRVKVYAEGMEGWTAVHPGAVTARQLAEAPLAGGMPIVLDARPAELAARGHVPGAVLAPPDLARSALEGLGMPFARERPPIVVYDEGRGDAAERAARQLVGDGYADVMVLEGGFRAWIQGRHTVAAGSVPARVVWSPRPKPGEIPWAEFSLLARAIPPDTIILDVRDEDEVKEGRIPGALNIPEQDLEGRLAELPRDRRIVAHCATGVRAEMAYHVLRERGYERVAFLNANVAFDQDGRVELSR